MRTRFLTIALSALGMLAACSEPTGPALESPSASVARGATRTVTAMTQNMYVGADVDAVIGALASPDPSDDIPALLVAIETLGATDYPARAGALAAAIAKARPHVVGLQEVSQIDIDLTALGLPAVVHLDFLAILGDSLAARGLQYAVAVKVRNIVAQPLPGIGLVDYDAILVDADRVTVTATEARTFAHNLGVVAPGVELKRGWVLARVLIGGAPYAFANTHLESGAAAGLSDLRAAQAMELVSGLSADVPTMVLGDLNDIPGSAMHHVLSGARFIDSWAALRGGAPGFTCCQRADLGNHVSALDQRIDYVWTRGFQRHRELDGRVWRIGTEPRDRIPGPLHPIWPSDHAGLVLTVAEAPAH